MRKYAREVAVCKIFEYLFSDDASTEVDGEFFKLSALTEGDFSYIDAVLKLSTGNSAFYKERIAAHLRGYKLERIRKIDLSLLICAMAEFDLGDAPKPVIINEIVDLTTKFSSEKSSKFINGLLAQYYRSLGE